jgi:hypothetical protein
LDCHFIHYDVSPLSAYEDYWEQHSTHEAMGNLWIKARMSRHEWYEMLQCITGNVDELMATAQQSFQQFWTPHQHVTVDEMMVNIYFT